MEYAGNNHLQIIKYLKQKSRYVGTLTPSRKSTTHSRDRLKQFQLRKVGINESIDRK